MGTATEFPEARDMTGEELCPGEALVALCRYGRRPLPRDVFVRLRHADGFTPSRALALHTVLSVLSMLSVTRYGATRHAVDGRTVPAGIPPAIAFVGLPTAPHPEDIGRLAELAIHRPTTSARRSARSSS
ncbi:hypothetical protein BM536_008400 [Streptomyces phaeoluteigriseus]|uniref:Uncharacterized protein n=1 Tax=Streptomyces phaeoluteigriseus TaxID=114686 RepID=A0A1V6MV93_9ACTN|nr:hypothetical protein [Streptomyces phaeoluteigriseus]OQD56292.1 hypothetical protein BM536_008400 [Streptomyces phaeoluteigriseus]